MTGPDGGAWVDAARSVTDTGVEAYRIGGDGDFADAAGRWAEAYGVTDGGAVLVRPDGFVAWRSADVIGRSGSRRSRRRSPCWSLLAAIEKLLGDLPR